MNENVDLPDGLDSDDFLHGLSAYLKYHDAQLYAIEAARRYNMHRELVETLEEARGQIARLSEVPFYSSTLNKIESLVRRARGERSMIPKWANESSVNAQLYEALARLFNLANHFNVNGVYFTEDDANREALEYAETILARARGD